MLVFGDSACTPSTVFGFLVLTSDGSASFFHFSLSPGTRSFPTPMIMLCMKLWIRGGEGFLHSAWIHHPNNLVLVYPVPFDPCRPSPLVQWQAIVGLAT